MTQEEKAKAYDEALKQAKFYHGNCPSEPERKKLEKMFPVLHESDDERVRKWLIAQMSSIVNTEAVKELDKDGYEMARKAIIYLEKQKENQYFVGYAKGYSEGQLNPKQKEQKSISQEDFDAAKHEALWGEQKPEHLELKAGHWYICHRAFCCRADVLTVKEGERFMCEKDGVVKGFVIKEPEKYFKECSAPAPMEDEQKEQKPELYYDKELDNAAREFYLSGGAKSPVDSTGLVPMVRMAEFGATWMKERMEKEQKPVDNPKWTELTWEDINYLEDLMSKVHYEFRNGIGAESFGKEVLEKFREYKDDDSMDGRKPALTPERLRPKFAVGDTICRPMYCDHTVREIYVRCNDPVYVCVNEEGLESHISFSEQDKWERKEQKQEWSEDDERMLTRCIKSIECSKQFADSQTFNEAKDKEINWLKSLRPQPHWKPSEEQMKWLKDVIETVPMTCRQQIPLESLYNDLLKLT